MPCASFRTTASALELTLLLALPLTLLHAEDASPPTPAPPIPAQEPLAPFLPPYLEAAPEREPPPAPWLVPPALPRPQRGTDALAGAAALPPTTATAAPADDHAGPTAAPAIAPQPAPPVPEGKSSVPDSSKLGWSHTGRIGNFINNIATSNGNADSPDPVIKSTSNSVNYLLALDTTLTWQGLEDSIDQHLLLKYGASKQPGQPWLKNNDDILYQGVFRRGLGKPAFVYGSWGFETVFAGPDPDNRALDPFQAHASVGYGQLYENLGSDKDRLEWRLGVRAQKYWGSQLADQQGLFLVGPELFIRYEREVNKSLRFFIETDDYGQFTDPGHTVVLATAGVAAKLNAYVTAEINFRTYHESGPKSAAVGAPGYNQWFYKEDALIGLAITF